MLKIQTDNQKDIYELSELAKMFMPAADFVVSESIDEWDVNVTGVDKNDKKRVLYSFLSGRLEKQLDWGILIGVRPLKLYHQLIRELGTEAADISLKEDYFLSEEKLQLLKRTAEMQGFASFDPGSRAAGLYVGIPFCPTRCLYCSFTSNKFEKKSSIAYLSALKKEIKAVKDIMEQRGNYSESIYIGGGTPSSLDDEEFEELLFEVRNAFKSTETKEFTVEMGRPDTITESKLRLVKEYGANRISINPQSMKAETLRLIGRAHSPEQIMEAFSIARAFGIECINTDLIAGLPEEGPEDFANSLNQILELKPENITVHTLAVKKASRLIEEDMELGIRQAGNVRTMLEFSGKLLKANDYSPYYLYRQKHMAGNFENVGYTKAGFQSLYNIRIMEENQSIFALGAGGISKSYYPEEDRLERIPNVSNYEIYIERIDEMIKRKEQGFL